jgi:hypothetical protein
MFVEIVIELETCHIYKAVLLTIKIRVHNGCRATRHKKELKHPKAIHSIIQ